MFRQKSNRALILVYLHASASTPRFIVSKLTVYYSVVKRALSHLSETFLHHGDHGGDRHCVHLFPRVQLDVIMSLGSMARIAVFVSAFVRASGYDPATEAAFELPFLTRAVGRRAALTGALVGGGLSSLSFFARRRDNKYGKRYTAAADDDEYGAYRDGYVHASPRGGSATSDRWKESYSLYYRLYNYDSPRPPLVVLHGGP